MITLLKLIWAVIWSFGVGLSALRMVHVLWEVEPLVTIVCLAAIVYSWMTLIQDTVFPLLRHGGK